VAIGIGMLHGASGASEALLAGRATTATVSSANAAISLFHRLFARCSSKVTNLQLFENYGA
jgi:hypothetical protein